MSIKLICASDMWVGEHEEILKTVEGEIIIADNEQLKKISALKTPTPVLAVVEIPQHEPDENMIRNNFSLVLDDIQDPGNLGTIVRIADWFGIKDIFCSPDTADVYNPKVIQATMGSVTRVNVHYLSLPDLFQYYDTVPVYGAMLEGEDIFSVHFGDKGFILIGNEGKGISEELRDHIKKGIRIPSYGGAESLNAGVATGIICALVRGGNSD